MSERIIDQSALRANQAFIIALLVIAFVFNLPVLVAFVAAVMWIGTVFPSRGLFKAIYQYALRPAGLARPDPRPDNPEPHRFAQGMGGSALVLAGLAFLANTAALGWGLTWVVIALAALNLFAGICVGCLMYYWLNRLGVPGFRAAPVRVERDVRRG